MRPQLEELERRDMPSGFGAEASVALPSLTTTTAFLSAGEQVLTGIADAATAAFAQATTLGPRGIQLFGPQIVALGEAAFTLEQEIVTTYLAGLVGALGGIDGQTGPASVDLPGVR